MVAVALSRCAGGIVFCILASEHGKCFADGIAARRGVVVERALLVVCKVQRRAGSATIRIVFCIRCTMKECLADGIARGLGVGIEQAFGARSVVVGIADFSARAGGVVDDLGASGIFELLSDSIACRCRVCIILALVEGLVEWLES